MKRLIIILLIIITSQITYSLGNLGSSGSFLNNFFETPLEMILKKLFFASALTTSAENSSHAPQGHGQMDEIDKRYQKRQLKDLQHRFESGAEKVFKDINEAPCLAAKKFKLELDLTAFDFVTTDNINTKMKNGGTILHFISSKIGNHPKGYSDYYRTCDHAKIEVIESIISRFIHLGLNINGKDDRGNTVLHHNQHIYLSEYLVKQGADLNIRNDHGETAFFCAVKSRNIDLISLYIEEGADCTIKNDQGENALFLIARGPGTAWDVGVLAQILIEQGINVNEQNFEGKTVLHEAILECNEKLISRLLTKKDIDFNLQDSKGRTPLDYAMNLDNDIVASYLQTHGGKRGVEL